MLRRYFATTLSNPVDGDLDTIMPSEYMLLRGEVRVV